MTAKPIQLLFDAMHHGKYEFEDFLLGDVTTSYDSIQVKRRAAYRPNKKLKAYHSFLNTFLFEYLTVNHQVVYSYRKGVNPHEALLAHVPSRAFFQTDIANFFGSIDRGLVKSTILERGTSIPILDFDCHIERILDLTTVDGSLPVGFSTSPPISNACLTGFDDELQKYCKNSGFVYTRYADDLVISAQSRDRLKGVEEKLNELLENHFSGKLLLNTTKSKLTSVGRKIKILGLVILPSGKVAVDMQLKKRVEVLLHFYVRNQDKFLCMVENDREAGVQKLSGYINYINAADTRYLEKLKRKFGTTVIDSFLHKSAK